MSHTHTLQCAIEKERKMGNRKENNFSFSSNKVLNFPLLGLCSVYPPQFNATTIKKLCGGERYPLPQGGATA